MLHSFYPQIAEGDGTILDALEVVVRDDFFDFVEIASIAEPSVRAKARTLLQAGRLRVGFGAHPLIMSQGLNLNHLDADERRRGLDVLGVALREAAELGAEWFTVMSGPDPGAAARDEGFSALAESLAALCEEAAGHSIRVLLELFDREIDKCLLVGPSPETALLAAKVRRGAANFGLVLDHGHIPLTHRSPEEAVAPVASFVDMVHLGNCVSQDRHHPLFGDNHPPYGYPGGDSDTAELAQFLRVLRKNGLLREGRRSLLSFEIRPPEGWDVRAVIEGAKRTLRAAWWLQAHQHPCLTAGI